MLKYRPARLDAVRCVLGMLAWSIALAANTGAAEPDGARLFREKIAPVLKAECFRCHSATAEKLRGGLRLDSREAILQGGDSGPAVVPGKSEESLLIQAIRHEDGLAMPPKKPKLSDPIIADFAALGRYRRALPSRHGKPVPGRFTDPASPRALGVPAGEETFTAEGERLRMGPQPDRCLHPRQARGASMAARAAGRARRMAPSRDLRRDRPAPLA